MIKTAILPEGRRKAGPGARLGTRVLRVCHFSLWSCSCSVVLFLFIFRALSAENPINSPAKGQRWIRVGLMFILCGRCFFEKNNKMPFDTNPTTTCRWLPGPQKGLGTWGTPKSRFISLARILRWPRPVPAPSSVRGPLTSSARNLSP